MDEFLIRLTGFVLLLVFFTFVAARIRKRINNGLETDFKELSSKHKLQPQERYFILDNLLGFPQAFLVCEETSFVVVKKKEAELKRIPYDQINLLRLPESVVFGKATLMKLDGLSIQLKLNQDAHIDFEKEWPKGLRNKILLQTLTGSDSPGKTANKHAELQLRLAYMRLAESCGKRGIQVEEANWQRNLDFNAKRE